MQNQRVPSMTTFIALLRAVNVGGTGKLPMADLRALCAEMGFGRIETYIASGNVVFDSSLSAQSVHARFEKRLLAHAGKPMEVFVRTAAEMATVLAKNPFAELDPALTYAFFLHVKPDDAVLDRIRGREREEITLGTREIYIHYPEGMGRSKLRIPAAASGTARNMKTVAKLVELGARADRATR